jgi:hypothetical protein
MKRLHSNFVSPVYRVHTEPERGEMEPGASHKCGVLTPLQKGYQIMNTFNSLHGTEPFLRSRQFCSYSTSQHFMEPEGSLPCSQEPPTGPYPEPDQSSPYHPLEFMNLLSIFNKYLKKIRFSKYRQKAKNKKSTVQLNGIPTSLLINYKFLNSIRVYIVACSTVAMQRSREGALVAW